MKLQEFFGNIAVGREVATPADNKQLCLFYSAMPMKGEQYSIKFVKDPDYFKFLKYESKIHFPMVVKNDEGRVETMGSLSIRPCYIDGKVDYVGHFADLRVMPKSMRKTKSDWKTFSINLLAHKSEIDELKGCRYLLGSYVMSNVQAVTAFKERSPIGISEIARYQMVSILGQPLKAPGVKSFNEAGMKVTVSIGQDSDIHELREFLDAQNKKRMLGYVFSGEHDELARRFQDWDDFSISSFFIARDESGKIAGCFGVWNQTRGRRLIIDKFPEELAREAAKIFNKAPKEGEELEILYLTTLELSNALTIEQKKYVFNEMLDLLYEKGIPKAYHMVSFCDYDRESIIGGMEKDYILQTTPTHLYQMVHPDSNDRIREEDFDVHVGHEMALT
jgi:hypothetical protein